MELLHHDVLLVCSRHKSHLKDARQAPSRINEWKPVGTSVRLLNGTLHQSRVMFGIWAGSQCVAMCVIAYLKSIVVPFNDWKSNTISEVILAGNRYYKNTLQSLNSLENPRHLLVNELPREPFFALGKVFEIDVADDPEFYGVERKADLNEQLTEFFEENTAGILIDSLGFARLVTVQEIEIENLKLKIFDQYIFYNGP